MRAGLFSLSLTIVLMLAISACVNTQVTSKVVGASQVSLKQITLIVVNSGSFSAGNTASGFGQKNLNSLIPHLQSRLPVVFTLNGIPTRLASSMTGSDGQNRAKLEPNESLVVVTPVSATYSSKSGQTLVLRAELLDRAKGSLVWRAEIHMATLGFGKFDDKVADRIAIQMLEKMREDGIVRLPGGPLLSVPKGAS